MEAVKDLVVGKIAFLRSMINKPLMNSRIYGGKSYIIASVFKYHLQAFDLLLTITQNVKCIAIGKHFLEVVANEVKIFVIYSLWTTFKVD